MLVAAIPATDEIGFAMSAALPGTGCGHDVTLLHERTLAVHRDRKDAGGDSGRVVHPGMDALDRKDTLGRKTGRSPAGTCRSAKPVPAARGPAWRTRERRRAAGWRLALPPGNAANRQAAPGALFYTAGYDLCLADRCRPLASLLPGIDEIATPTSTPVLPAPQL